MSCRRAEAGRRVQEATKIVAKDGEGVRWTSTKNHVKGETK